MKYYIEKSNIDDQPKISGTYFTNLGRLWFSLGAPGKWYYDNSQLASVPPVWYLEECADPVKGGKITGYEGRRTATAQDMVKNGINYTEDQFNEAYNK